jgi:hypothetical protein
MRPLTRLLTSIAWLALLLLAGCGGLPSHENPGKLVIYPDGSMAYRNRPIPKEDVVLYPDGYGGQKAAVRVHMAPLHPDFFQGAIVVERIRVPASETVVTQN